MKILKSFRFRKSIMRIQTLRVTWRRSKEILITQKAKLKKPIDVNYVMVVQLNKTEAQKLGFKSAIGAIQGEKKP